MVLRGYSHKASVVLSEAHWMEAAAEGRIRLDLGNTTVECFVGAPHPDVPNKVDARIGKSIDVYLSLYTRGPEVTDSRKKSIQELPRGRRPNRYEVSGQVIAKTMTRYTFSDSSEFDVESIVIDCGVPVHIIRYHSTDTTIEPFSFKEGDWVRAIGRMDVRFPGIEERLWAKLFSEQRT